MAPPTHFTLNTGAKIPAVGLGEYWISMGLAFGRSKSNIVHFHRDLEV